MKNKIPYSRIIFYLDNGSDKEKGYGLAGKD